MVAGITLSFLAPMLLLVNLVTESIQPQTRSNRMLIGKFMSGANVYNQKGGSNLVPVDSNRYVFFNEPAVPAKQVGRRKKTKQLGANRHVPPASVSDVLIAAPLGVQTGNMLQPQKAVDWDRVEQTLQARLTSTGFGRWAGSIGI